MYSDEKCDEMLAISGGEAFILPQPHAFCLTSKLIRATLTHNCR